MHKIYHISRFTLQTGLYDIKNAMNSLLIRICDPGMQHATPYSDFHRVLDLEFLDATDECGFAESDKFSLQQGMLIHRALFQSHILDQDVYVQCEQGISRSAAIAKVAALGGYTCANTGVSTPNQRVMRLLGYCFGVKIELPH